MLVLLPFRARKEALQSTNKWYIHVCYDIFIADEDMCTVHGKHLKVSTFVMCSQLKYNI